jgi:predicted nuclease with TOPRIM domain
MTLTLTREGVAKLKDASCFSKGLCWKVIQWNKVEDENQNTENFSVNLDGSENTSGKCVLGIFYVDTIENNDYSCNISAYDGMLAFEKSVNAQMLNYFRYTEQPIEEWLKFICLQCVSEGYDFSYKIEETAVNLDTNYVLSTDVKVETFREALGYLSILVGGFATFDEDGDLILRTYKYEPVDLTLSHKRLLDGKFDSNKSVVTGVYSSVAGFDFEDVITSVEDTNSVSIYISENPFLRGLQPYNSKEVDYRITNSLEAISGIMLGKMYYGCDCTLVSVPYLDLGDCVSVNRLVVTEEGVSTDILENNIVVCDYTYNAGSSLQIKSTSTSGTSTSVGSSGVGSEPKSTEEDERMDEIIDSFTKEVFEYKSVEVPITYDKELEDKNLSCFVSETGYTTQNAPPEELPEDTSYVYDEGNSEYWLITRKMLNTSLKEEDYDYGFTFNSETYSLATDEEIRRDLTITGNSASILDIFADYAEEEISDIQLSINIEDAKRCSGLVSSGALTILGVSVPAYSDYEASIVSYPPTVKPEEAEETGVSTTLTNEYELYEDGKFIDMRIVGWGSSSYRSGHEKASTYDVSYNGVSTAGALKPKVGYSYGETLKYLEQKFDKEGNLEKIKSIDLSFDSLSALREAITNDSISLSIGVDTYKIPDQETDVITTMDRSYTTYQWDRDFGGHVGDTDSDTISWMSDVEEVSFDYATQDWGTYGGIFNRTTDYADDIMLFGYKGLPKNVTVSFKVRKVVKGTVDDVINALNKDTSEVEVLKAVVTDLSGRVDAHSIELEAIKAELGELTETVSSHTESINTINETLVSLDEKLTGLDEKVTGFEEVVSGVEAYESRIEALETKVEAYETRIDDVETKVSEFEEVVSGVEAYETRIGNLETNVTKLLKDVEEIPAILESLEALTLRVENLEQGEAPEPSFSITDFWLEDENGYRFGDINIVDGVVSMPTSVEVFSCVALSAEGALNTFKYRNESSGIEYQLGDTTTELKSTDSINVSSSVIFSFYCISELDGIQVTSDEIKAQSYRSLRIGDYTYSTDGSIGTLSVVGERGLPSVGGSEYKYKFYYASSSTASSRKGVLRDWSTDGTITFEIGSEAVGNLSPVYIQFEITDGYQFDDDYQRFTIAT